MEVCGCSGNALRLFKSYFSERYLHVVAMGIQSGRKKFTAGVPQGGIWSPKMWNFYIQDLPCRIMLSLLFKYADDCTLLKVFEPGARQSALMELNDDLKRVARWGRRWKTTFEPSKTHAMFVSNTRDNGFYPAIDRLQFDGVYVGYENELKVVGVIYDHKLTWGPMLAEMTGRGRRALGYLNRLGRLVTPYDIAQVYRYFVRSKMEYGNASYIGAAKSHLARLDAVQGRAERLSGGILFQPLAGRRDAACFGLLCKILDGQCVRALLDMCPGFELDTTALDLHDHNTRFQQAQERSIGLVRVTNMRDTLRDKSLMSFERSFICRAYDIFNMIPNDLKKKGLINGSWSHIMKDGQRHLSSR